MCVHFNECPWWNHGYAFAAPRPCLRLFCSSIPACFDLLPFFHCDSGLSQQQEPTSRSTTHGHSVRGGRNAEGFAHRNVIQCAFAPPRADRGMMWVWYFLLGSGTGSGSVGESLRLHPLFLWISFCSAISTAVAVVFQQCSVIAAVAFSYKRTLCSSM